MKYALASIYIHIHYVNAVIVLVILNLYNIYYNPLDYKKIALFLIIFGQNWQFSIKITIR